MLHVIFLLFKIIGLILLVLLGLIVGILLILLLVPIRYRVRVAHGEELRLEGSVSWLLHIIHARISQDGDQRRILLRIFGIVLYDSLRPKKTKAGRGRRRNRSEGHSRMEDDPATPEELNTSEGVTGDGSGENDDVRKKKSEYSTEDILQTTIQLPEKETVNRENGKANRTEQTDSLEKESLRDRTAGSTVRMDSESSLQDGSDGIPEQERKEEEEERETFFVRILHKLGGIFRGIINKLHSIRQGIKNTFRKIVNLKQKISLIMDFLREEENREAFQVTFYSLKKLLKHILPTRLKSEVTFGTGDPCSTGKALGAISILYSFYGDNIRITPDFENKIFEGTHYARGRIRIGSLLIILIRLILDKKFKQLKRNFKILKEAL